MSKRYSLSGTFLPRARSQTKSVCVIDGAHQLMCALTRIYITCTSKTYVDVPELSHPRGRGRRTCNAAVWRFWRGNRNHYFLVLVMRALDMSIHVRTHLPKFINEMHYDVLP